MSYLSSYIPTPNATQRSVKTSWAGLNRKQAQDTGELSKAHNISMKELPYLKSTEASTEVWDASRSGHFPDFNFNICSMHDVGDGAFVVFCYSGDADLLSMYYFDETGHGRYIRDIDWESGETPAVAVFNVYKDVDTNIVTATFQRKILIYPCCYSYMPGENTVELFNTQDNPVPKLKHVTVLNGRVFGVLDGKIFASTWNDYANWVLPDSNTATEDMPNMAWVSTTQSDIDASGEFTGITVYNGQVIGFKRNFMHMIYNNKNPFRIVDIAKVGAISQAAICEVNQTLFFIADDGVYAFSGGYPKRISDKLDISVGDWEGAVLGGDDTTLYCYVPSQGETYTYDTVNGAWGCIVEDAGMCATVGGECLFIKGDTIYKFGGNPNTSFEFETDASFGGSLVEKKIKRLRLQVSHEVHNDGDYITVSVAKANGSIAASKTLTPTGSCDTVLSMLTRMTCDFGQKIRVEGKGDWEIRYLQIDYEPGGEKYV